MQAIFDNTAIAEKKLPWFYGTTAQEGYLEFQRPSQPMQGWFERYMA